MDNSSRYKKKSRVSYPWLATVCLLPLNFLYPDGSSLPPPPHPLPSLSSIRSTNLMTLWNDLTVRRNISAHVTNITPLQLKKTSRNTPPSTTSLMAENSDEKTPATYLGCPVLTASVWGQGSAEYGHLSTTHTYPGFGFFSSSVQGGIDYTIGESNLFGGSISYSHIHGYQEHNGGHNKTSSNLGALYAVGTVGSWHFLPILLGGLNETNYSRNSHFTPSSKATLKAWQLVPHLEINYEEQFEWGSVIPFVSSDWAISWQGSYREKEHSLQRISQKAHTNSLVRTETGLHLYEQWDMKWGTFFLREKMAYVFEKTFGIMNDSYTLVGLPGTFTASSSNLTLNLGLIRIDAVMTFGTCQPFLFSIGYEGEFGSEYWSSQMVIELLERF